MVTSIEERIVLEESELERSRRWRRLSATLPAGSHVTFDAEMKTKGSKAELVIEMRDNGPGLPKHNRNRLLEPYVTTKGNKGTGLGLAIVLKSVEQHGGTLSLEDAPPAPGRSHGALIRISLPLSKSPVEKSSQEQPETAAANGGA